MKQDRDWYLDINTCTCIGVNFDVDSSQISLRNSSGIVQLPRDSDDLRLKRMQWKHDVYVSNFNISPTNHFSACVYNCPDAVMTTLVLGCPDCEPCASIFFTTSMPEVASRRPDDEEAGYLRYAGQWTRVRNFLLKKKRLPSKTSPKTVCLPSNHGVGTAKKNNDYQK